tara:strand:+ start:1260 stop:1619 length:360 start_codon:yes stop_codon:yes gene_type:complete
MITKHDIDAFVNMIDVRPQDYSYWVEGKIVTEGETRLIENTLGLVGEAGEVAEKIKKMLRDSNKVSPDEIVKELGDVVFYATALANYFDSSLTEVLQANMDKLNSRAKRGVIKGSGDNR